MYVKHFFMLLSPPLSSSELDSIITWRPPLITTDVLSFVPTVTTQVPSFKSESLIAGSEEDI